eukprot:2959800-Amphidinium_carterae.1
MFVFVVCPVIVGVNAVVEVTELTIQLVLGFQLEVMMKYVKVLSFDMELRILKMIFDQNYYKCGPSKTMSNWVALAGPEDEVLKARCSSIARAAEAERCESPHKKIKRVSKGVKKLRTPPPGTDPQTPEFPKNLKK